MRRQGPASSNPGCVSAALQSAASAVPAGGAGASSQLPAGSPNKRPTGITLLGFSTAGREQRENKQESERKHIMSQSGAAKGAAAPADQQGGAWQGVQVPRPQGASSQWRSSAGNNMVRSSGAGDDGWAVGAAVWGWSTLLEWQRLPPHRRDCAGWAVRGYNELRCGKEPCGGARHSCVASAAGELGRKR